MTTLILTQVGSAEEQADEEGEGMAVLMIHEQGIEQAGDGEGEDQHLCLARLPYRQLPALLPEDEEEDEERRQSDRPGLDGDQHIFVMGIGGRQGVVLGGQRGIGALEAAGAGAEERMLEKGLGPQAQELDPRIGAALGEARRDRPASC